MIQLRLHGDSNLSVILRAEGCWRSYKMTTRQFQQDPCLNQSRKTTTEAVSGAERHPTTSIVSSAEPKNLKTEAGQSILVLICRPMRLLYCTMQQRCLNEQSTHTHTQNTQTLRLLMKHRNMILSLYFTMLHCLVDI